MLETAQLIVPVETHFHAYGHVKAYLDVENAYLAKMVRFFDRHLFKNCG